MQQLFFHDDVCSVACVKCRQLLWNIKYQYIQIVEMCLFNEYLIQILILTIIFKDKATRVTKNDFDLKKNKPENVIFHN